MITNPSCFVCLASLDFGVPASLDGLSAVSRMWSKNKRCSSRYPARNSLMRLDVEELHLTTLLFIFFLRVFMYCQNFVSLVKQNCIFLIEQSKHWTPNWMEEIAFIPIDVQTGGTARPGPSPFEPGPFEPGPFEPGLLTGPGRAARRAASHVRARHYTGPSVPGRPGKPDPRMSPAQPEHAK
jgi:hypothetical protein